MNTKYQLLNVNVRCQTRAFTKDHFNALAIKTTGLFFKKTEVVPVTVALLKQSSTIYYEWRIIQEGHSSKNKCLVNFLKNEGKEPAAFYVACNNKNPDWIKAIRRSEEIQNFHGNSVC